MEPRSDLLSWIGALFKVLPSPALVWVVIIVLHILYWARGTHVNLGDLYEIQECVTQKPSQGHLREQETPFQKVPDGTYDGTLRKLPGLQLLP